MTPEATLWAATQRSPLVACPEDWTTDAEHDNNLTAEEIGRKHPPTCGCGGTGEARSDIYRAIERAVTVPCDHTYGGMHGWTRKQNDCQKCDRTGRVLRPQPGVMACGGRAVEVPNDGSGVDTVHMHGNTPADECSGTVPDPSEAGVVARAEALGRFWLVEKVVMEAPDDSLLSQFYHPLLNALLDQNYPGVLAATLAAVRALAAVGKSR